MKYRYSKLVNPSCVDKAGFCQDPAYQLRCHQAQQLAADGSARAARDWADLVGPCDTDGSCCSPAGHFVCLTMPESLPERVASLAYFMDSQTEAVAVDLENTLSDHDKLLQHSNPGPKQIQAKIVLELLSVDRACGENVIATWKEWAVNGGNKLNKHHRFHTFDEYVNYRVVDSGAEVGVQLMNYGVANAISLEELSSISHITRPAYVALCLANDYFSFEAEYAAFQAHHDAESMANGVFVLMQVKKLGVSEAKLHLKKIVRENEDEFLRLKAAEEATLPPQLRTVLDGLVHMVVGNLCWSVVCPRYSRKCDIKPGNVPKKLNGAKKCANEHHAKISSETRANEANLSNGLNGTKEPKLSNGISRVTPIDWYDSKVLMDVGCGRKLSKQLVNGPAAYTQRLPSKRIRENLIDALNGWLRVAPASTLAIKNVVNSLHSSSLMLDDIEDSSPLRRGEPAAHIVYGVPLTINSANYLYILALENISKLTTPDCLGIFIEEVRNMEIGQSHDLYWTRTMQCPSVGEYLQMVDMKTGALFSLLARLLMAEAPNDRHVSFDGLVTVAGRYFQIRDDWNNLVSSGYEAQKGFCEDLDEGKYSFPLIHTLNHANDSDKLELQSMLCERRLRDGLTPELKRRVLRIMEHSGSLELTRAVLVRLQTSIENELAKLEEAFNAPNWMLRLAFEKLKVDIPMAVSR
ncbi:Fusicoccadiene synthase 3 [Colletotrichum plurivorum]|uniref:Fusicoccadiene synthase 3 n=1 Tax=Colletotrichum plurivorum TaxID=2175906 RepID=A0A8H6NBM5_9PEZI|nr:Fusicoccadiene synthase 3 [Colletotrichum plurivorum]